ncbi:MAG: S1 RNA-binding domain-containing protein [Candidatus Blackburnbacteria bacterium]|nr:S1 RNA-binding domain-containing protein [Candidatus Blackburnbacteria bacterium]
MATRTEKQKNRKTPVFAGASAGKQVSKAKSSNTSSGGKAATMDELLARTGYKIRSFARGEKVTGKIINIGPKAMTLDIGAKSEGVVADREFEAARHLVKNLKAGDEIEAEVVVPEERGQIFLSLRTGAESRAWELLKEHLKEGKETEVKVDSFAKGGLSVSVFGLKGYVPGSHLGGSLVKNPGSAFGRTIKVKVIEADREKNRIILSEKAVSEAQALAEQDKVLEGIKRGDKFKGEVVGIVPFGAFVRIEKDGVPVDGLVHLSELSWQKVSDAGAILKAGDKVDVVVIGKDSSPPAGGLGRGGRLAFSIKQMQKDPWDDIQEKYKKEEHVKGSVVRAGDFGAIVELEPGIEGIVHLSKIPAGILLKEGSPVDCFIEKIDKKNRKISLGLALKEKPIGYK